MLDKKDIKNIKEIFDTKIDDLAVIINKGFDNQMEHMDKKFAEVDKKFDSMDERFKHVATKQQVQILETKIDKVDERLKKVETVLNDAHVL